MHLGSAHLRWALIFGPSIWSIAVERRGLVLDTRRTPAAGDAPRPGTCLYLLLRGCWTIHPEGSPRFVAPAAFVVSEEQLEPGSGERPLTFTSWGDPDYAAIEIHHDASDVAPPPEPLREPLHIAPATWQAAGEVIRVSRDDDDDAYRAAFATLIDRLVRDGALPAGLKTRVLRPTSRPFVLLWNGVRPMIERLYLSPTLQELGAATGVSLRQMDRHVRSFLSSFGIVGRHWRSTTRHFRLKLAVILLSAEHASVAEVAAAVGYGSSD